MSGIAEFLAAQYDRIEEAAQAATEGPWTAGAIADDIGAADVLSESGNVTSAREEPCCPVEDAVHISIHDPDWVLADIESKRQIIREVMSWRHDVVEGDCWFTCGAATEERDGGECCNDNQRNECTCGLDVRREKILSLLAAPFSGEPGYDAEGWTV